LIALIAAEPFLQDRPRGRIALVCIHAQVLVAACAALPHHARTLLTSTGFGDIAPVSDIAKTLCVLEQITGVLFLTAMIARLVVIYLPRESGE